MNYALAIIVALVIAVILAAVWRSNAKEMQKRVSTLWTRLKEADARIAALVANKSEFVSQWNRVQYAVHDTAQRTGWWDERRLAVEMARRSSESLADYVKATCLVSALALVDTEIGEAIENVRCGSVPDDKITQFTGVEAECADAVIRIMDIAQGYGLRVAEAIDAKMAMNKTRPRKHGKLL